jgi:hypothetical protein
MEELAGKVWVDEENFFGHLATATPKENLGHRQASTQHTQKNALRR